MNMIIMYLHVSNNQNNVNAVFLQKPLDGASDQQCHGGDHIWNHMAWRQIRQVPTCDDGTPKNIKEICIYVGYIYFSKWKYDW